MQADKIYMTVTLSDGRIGQIVDGRLRHLFAAMDTAGERCTNGQMFRAIMQQLLLIDGQRQTLEQLDDLALEDYVLFADSLGVILGKLNIMGS